MDWSGGFLSIILIYAGIRFMQLFTRSGNKKYLVFSLASFFYMVSSLIWMEQFFDFSTDTQFQIKNLLDFFRVCGVALAMSALSIENWNDRPPVARYPYALNFVPLLLIPTILMVYETIYYKELMTGIYESAGIFIGLILYGLLTVRNFNYVYILLGTVLILLAFVVHWFPGGAIREWPFIWNLIGTISVFTFVRGYVFLDKRTLDEEEEFDD